MKFARLLPALLMTSALVASAAAPAAPAKDRPSLPWIDSLETGLRRAVDEGRPLLVRASGQSCPWCKKLEQELPQAEVQTELANWVLVAIDVEHSSKEVQRLGIGPIPALRALSRQGAIVASHDGYLPPADLVAWLAAARDKLAAVPDDALAAEGEPTAVDVVRLVRALGVADATIREAALRRLLPYPVASVPAVVRTMHAGKLGARLAALELLRQWQAPIDALDPWQPESLSPQRLAALDAWATRAALGRIAVGGALDAAELAAARADIARMLTVSDGESLAIMERLARFGPRLLDEVRADAARTETDEARQRLTALRYRLVASTRRVLQWPGGIQRLAAHDADERHRAADELAAHAVADDQPLLLELFADPDPLVRELSLRALKLVAADPGAASNALAHLLEDPEPNVRAAVLKQLADAPPMSMVPRLCAYVLKEPDADLVVHAVRALRAAKSPVAIDSLMKLLEHGHWQVRAEAAETLGKIVEEFKRTPNAKTADAYAALVGRLSDDDAFVASRATAALKGMDLVDAVGPMIRLVERHPEIAPSVIEALVAQPRMRAKAMPQLRKFATHPDPAVRAAVVAGLCESILDAEPELSAALADPTSQVRTAAARAIFKTRDAEREAAFRGFALNAAQSEMSVAHVHVAPSGPLELITGGLKTLLGAYRAGKAKPSKPKADDKQSEETATDKEDKEKEKDRAKPADASPAEDEPPDAWTAWILKSQAGKHRVSSMKWMDRVAGPLKKLLAAKDEDERLAAATALVALGHSPAALPTLLAAARQPHPKSSVIASVLPWLLWPQRRELFECLVQHLSADDSDGLFQQLTEIPDARAADLLWPALADPGVSGRRAMAIYRALQPAYLGQQYYNISTVSAAQKKRMLAEAEAKIDPQRHWQTVAALALVADAKPELASELAAKLAADAKADDAVRRDAFQLSLLCGGKVAGRKAAIAALNDARPGVRRVALLYLTSGGDSLNVLGTEFYLYLQNRVVFVSGDTARGESLEAPRGLTPEMLTPLVDDANADNAARARFLLVLLGQHEQLAPLVDYWRAHRLTDSAWTKLVYRAIAAANDASQVHVLIEIYKKLESGELKDFYWTIRSMTGPEVLKLRKQIRSEHGASVLQ